MNPPQRLTLAVMATLLLAARTPGGDAVPDPATRFFHEEVAPILVKQCVECHNSTTRKGGLSIETLGDAAKGGEDGAGVVPGRPLESLLYTRVLPESPGEKPEMPKRKPPLSAEDAGKIRRWIESGAAWPKDLVLKEKARADKSFWSFQPVKATEPPRTAGAPEAWQQNPVDRFIYARLREKALEPNGPAEPRALIRRMTYDVIGLPPSPAEVEAFVAASAVDPEAAVAALAERLLASPQYGEQWGRHWLDVVRFGESRGYERNQIITNLWPFRDYVIRSFNDDKPFDQFIREHLAGDVIGAGKPEVEVGSAFLVAGPYDDVNNQDPVAAAQIRADQMDEMIRATSEAFLGLTLGCARCHDHKFDPLLTADYYSLYSTFAGTVHGERAVATPEATAAREEKLKPLLAGQNALGKERDDIKADLAKRAQAAEAEEATHWTRPRVSRYGTEEKFAPVEAKFVRLLVDANDSDDATKGGFTLDEFEVWSGSRNVALAANGGRASGKSKEMKEASGGYGVECVNDGIFGVRWQPAGRELVIEFAAPERIERVVFSSDRLKSLAEDYYLTRGPGEYRIEASLDGKSWTQIASGADRVPPGKLVKEARLLAKVETPEERARLAELARKIAALQAQIDAVPSPPVWWVGTHPADKAKGPFFVFLGGNPQRHGPEVAPKSLNVCDGAPSSYRLDAPKPEGERRLALANWITAADNPLTARVLANRVWHYHFGHGIVDTPSDFGFMGGRPTHPELLDWLAAELVRGGWKLKALHRLILTSQTYRQSAAWRDTAGREDGDSRLLWRFPPRRLTAEEVRDTLLAVAGKLDLTPGGEGFRLYEYQQDNVATYVPLDTAGPATYRRAIYHHNARSARVDLLTDFDAPDPAIAEPRRASTTTPLQALTLMNHRFALEMAQALADRLRREAGESDVAGQVRLAIQLADGREATEDEVPAAVALVQKFGLRAFCRALLNSNELVTLQ